MRTKEKQMEGLMMETITSAIRRSRATLLEDIAGVAALFVTLIAALHLPGFF